MTIAVGLVHREGVLLCADTELTGQASKSYAAKVRHFECKWGRIGIAYAGNEDNAAVVSEKLEKALKSLRIKDTLPKIEEIVEVQYRRLVYRNPNPNNADYALLLVLRPKGKQASLYVTSEIAVRAINTYRIIGIGDALGEQLIEPGFGMGGTSEAALLLAVNAITLVKRRVSFCGGPSMYLDLRNDGTFHEWYGDPFLERLEKWVEVYHFLSWNLLTHFANRQLSESDFIKNLEVFGGKLIEARRKFEDDAKLHQMRKEAMEAITKDRS